MKHIFKIYVLVAMVVFVAACSRGKEREIFTEQDNYQYSSHISNWGIQHEFPDAWNEQDWDYTKWNKNTHPDEVVLNFFKGEIFKKHYMKNRVPILVVDKVFYKLSNQDRRRVVKFFVERSRVLEKGYGALQLVDWQSNEPIGSYTDKGLFLN